MPESGLKPEVCNLIKETLAQVFSCEFGACKFIIKETLVQVFFCEFCEIFKNTFFDRTSSVAACRFSLV